MKNIIEVVKVQNVSVDEMMNDKINSAYNPTEWKKSVLRYAKYSECQFYKAEKGAFSYDRFYVSYKIDGFYFLSQWDAFCSSLTNNSFVKAYVMGGAIHKQYFNGQNGQDVGVQNTATGRAWLRDNICSEGKMISNCI